MGRLTKAERNIVEALKKMPYITIQCPPIDHTGMDLTLTVTGSKVAHDLALAVQAHFSDLNEQAMRRDYERRFGKDNLHT